MHTFFCDNPMNQPNAKPRLSIVTVTYNEPAALRDTIASLAPCLTADFSWEHIVVDSSPDLSLPVLQQANADWPLAHVVQPPHGIFAAINEGLRRCRGDYVWILNGGDLLNDSAILQKALSYLHAHAGASMLCCSALRAGQQSASYPCRPSKHFLLSIIGDAASVCHNAIIYRKSVFDTLGFYDERFSIASDYEYHLRCRHAGLTIKTSRDILTRYRSGGYSEVNYREGYRQLKEIHRIWAGRQPMWLRIAHSLFRTSRFARVRCIRFIQQTPFAGFLQQSYAAWRRALSRLGF
jgi:glycosyltransferase involved in cell wall biosynthesis